jgi:hypothetical protein
VKKTTPLYISIPQPCSEDWEKMTPDVKGRFCSNCQKTVIDFSYLSDTEIYHFFKDRKDIPCGRFHNSQLNTPLVPVERRKNFWTNIYKPVAATLAFLSLKYAATAMGKKETPVTISPVTPWCRPVVANDEKIIISGTVKDMFGKPLEKAEIKLNDKLVAVTNLEGQYEFEFVNDPAAKTYMLYISYGDLVTVVRNYNPVMLSTSYDAVLRIATEGALYGGIPFISYDFSPVAFCFKKNELLLNKQMLSNLDSVAVEMRNKPTVQIRIIAHSLAAANKTRQNLIKKHLVYKEGISEDRIVLSTELNKEMEHIIEILPVEN